MNPQIKQAKLETLEAIIKEVEGMFKTKKTGEFAETIYGGAYNQALSDLLTKLQAQKELVGKEL